MKTYKRNCILNVIDRKREINLIKGLTQKVKLKQIKV
jgi:hypothetical protein